jgi:hypothetical protein
MFGRGMFINESVLLRVRIVVCLVTCVFSVCYRLKHLPWCIELHSANQSRSEPTVSSIEEIAAFEPNDIMVCSEYYGGYFSPLHSLVKSVVNRV